MGCKCNVYIQKRIGNFTVEFKRETWAGEWEFTAYRLGMPREKKQQPQEGWYSIMRFSKGSS